MDLKLANQVSAKTKVLGCTALAALVLSFVFLLSWVGELMRLIFAVAVAAQVLFAAGDAWQECQASRGVANGAEKTCYSVPRRFGLAHALGITVAFAVLFTCLRLVDADPSVYVYLIAFFTFIGLLQMLMDVVPRKASVVAGCLFMPAAVAVGLLIHDPKVWLRSSPITIAWATAWNMIVGGILGYVGGAVVAATFLCIDFLAGRLRWGNSAAPKIDGRDSAAAPGRTPVSILPAGRDRTIAYVMMFVAGVCWILILSAVVWSLFWWWLRLGLS